MEKKIVYTNKKPFWGRGILFLMFPIISFYFIFFDEHFESLFGWPTPDYVFIIGTIIITVSFITFLWYGFWRAMYLDDLKIHGERVKTKVVRAELVLGETRYGKDKELWIETYYAGAYYQFMLQFPEDKDFFLAIGDTVEMAIDKKDKSKYSIYTMQFPLWLLIKY